MTIEASAPAKIILTGEHAVVYGAAALAIPIIHLRAYARLTRSSGGLRIVSTDTGEILTEDDRDNPYINLVHSIVKDQGCNKVDAVIEIHSDVPPASGLGSGASVATAISRTVFQFLEVKPSLDLINRYVYESERYFHGSPSGIDNTVIVHEKPILFIKSEKFRVFSSKEKLRFVIANSGKKPATSDTVGDVRRQYDANPKQIQSLFDRINEIGHKAKHAIEQGKEETLGLLMKENHLLLQRLNVSSDKLDELVNAAVDAGAIGAKLSGAGRGGNIIALVQERYQAQVVNVLQEKGALSIYETTLT